MKVFRKIFGLLSIAISVICLEVNADNYKIKELIPVDNSTTIRGEDLLYKDIKYDKDGIIIGKVKNISDEKKSITVSIGLFDEKRRNINIINYCSTEDALEAGEEKFNYVIDIDESKFPDGKKISDVKYFSILSENSSCRLGGEKEFVGEKVEDIYVSGSGELPYGARLLLNIIKVAVGILIVLFLYKFLFTNAYRNMDGDDVRRAFNYKNKVNARKREIAARNNPPKPKTVKKTKTDKVLEQEAKEKSNEHKDNSELHDFYNK